MTNRPGPGAGGAFGASPRHALPQALGTGPCPCGSGGPGRDCCGPVLAGARVAATAEELMRSRYTAFVTADLDHLVRTWHPRTRPEDLALDATRWSGLTVLQVEGGGEGDEEGTVEFEARWSGPGGAGALHETSRFVRRAGRWVYLAGVHH